MSGEKDAGFALLGVLAILLLAGAILATLTATSVETHLGSHAEFERLRIRQHLLGVARATTVHVLRSEEGFDPDRKQGPWLCRLSDSAVRVLVRDHSGLIDLNAASLQLLALGFRSLGRDRARSRELAAGVIRFRSRQAGESEVASVVEARHGPKMAPFEAVSELADFGSLRDVPLSLLEAVFTVHSGSGTLHLPSASPALVRTIEAAGMENEPYIVRGRSRRPALSTIAEDATVRDERAPTFAVSLSLVPDRKVPGRFRTLEVHEHGTGAVSDEAAGPCPPRLRTILDGARDEGRTR